MIPDPDRYITWLESELVWFRLRYRITLWPQAFKAVRFLYRYPQGVHPSVIAEHIGCKQTYVAKLLYKFYACTGVKPATYHARKHYPSDALRAMISEEYVRLWDEAKSTLQD